MLNTIQSSRGVSSLSSSLGQLFITSSSLSSSCTRACFSTLVPTQLSFRRKYPFPTILYTTFPLPLEKYLWYTQQNPNYRPNYKSKLVVDIRDLGLNGTEMMVLREMVGKRYNPVTYQIKFTSNNLGDQKSNENMVFQMLDECMKQCKIIAKQMESEGYVHPLHGKKKLIQQLDSSSSTSLSSSSSSSSTPSLSELNDPNAKIELITDQHVRDMIESVEPSQRPDRKYLINALKSSSSSSSISSSKDNKKDNKNKKLLSYKKKIKSPLVLLIEESKRKKRQGKDIRVMGGLKSTKRKIALKASRRKYSRIQAKLKYEEKIIQQRRKAVEDKEKLLAEKDTQQQQQQ